MGKKSINKIDDKLRAGRFIEYLKGKIGAKSFQFLVDLSSFSEVLIFSGVLRNYFINYNGPLRDFDIVIDGDEFSIERFLTNVEHTRNSFGGYKIVVDSLKIDIWHIERTWAYTNKKVELQLFKEYNLPNTAFFNFSSVVFDFNNMRFIYSSSFESFLETKEIDLVLEENPMPQLCIVNTIYYMSKFHLNISKRLKKYIIEHFNQYTEEDYCNVQIKHFSQVKFPYPYLREYFNIFKKDIIAS